MLLCEWNPSKGWGAPCIVPCQNIILDPSTHVFHYALECFEGMKAYKVIFFDKKITYFSKG